ncbi:DUF397 domain-containing protein [Streptomyces gobiensis]|uniref:DUF397 domain-containing protein n=1 Tax=Streptomyces gobiensis TaxID=2875706 RepID=UPI0030CDF499
MTTPPAWQKSSFSGTQGECVELAAADGAIKIRESDEPHTVLSSDGVRLRALISHVKAGQLNYLPEETVNATTMTTPPLQGGQDGRPWMWTASASV